MAQRFLFDTEAETRPLEEKGAELSTFGSDQFSEVGKFRVVASPIVERWAMRCVKRRRVRPLSVQLGRLSLTNSAIDGGMSARKGGQRTAWSSFEMGSQPCSVFKQKNMREGARQSLCGLE